MEEKLDLFKKDKLYGKQFDFKLTVKLSDKLYKRIISKLLATITETDFSEYLLEVKFEIKDTCIACVKVSEHPDKIGIVEVVGFKIFLTP